MTQKANETDNPGKFKDIIMRRLRRGECFHMPYFGCREFPANFCLCEEERFGRHMRMWKKRIWVYALRYGLLRQRSYSANVFPGCDETGRSRSERL